MFGGTEGLSMGVKVALIIVLVLVMMVVSLIVQIIVGLLSGGNSIIIGITSLAMTAATIYACYLIATKM